MDAVGSNLSKSGHTPRLLIIEEALRDREGHWFEYNRATKSAVQIDSPVHVEILGNHTMQQDVADELQAKPFFRFTVWDQIYNHPQSWKRYLGILHHNYRLYRDLNRYFRTANYNKSVFAPTVVLHHLLAYHFIASRYAGRKFDQLILLMRNNVAIYDETGKRTFRGTARFWKWAIQRFKRMINAGTVRFVTDSERLADEYQELTGIRFEVLPHPSLVGMSTVQSAPCDNEARGVKSNPIQLILPGPARYEKGVDRLLEAIRELGAEPESAHLQFIFQWSQPFSLPDGSMLGPDDVERFGSDRISFKTIRTPLSSDDYRQLLVNSDFVILPYRIEGYFSRISGVAVEAMMLGKPVLFTQNTWIDTISKQFATGLSMGGDARSIAAAIRQAISQCEELRQIAKARQPDVAEFFSGRNFRDLLFGRDHVIQ